MANEIKLNQLKPLLKPHHLYEGDRNIVVEAETGKGQVVLPIENEPILTLLNGENTVKDISAALYNSQGQVSFHSIITTVKLLKDANLLEEMEGEFKQVQEEKSPYEQKPAILNRPLYELKYFTKTSIKFKSDLVFFIVAAALIAVLALNYQAFTHLNISRFLKSPQGYDEALFRIFFISSLLMSMKSVIQGVLLLCSTGTFYGPSLFFFPYAISLGVNDNSIYSHPKKNVIISYGVLSSILYLVSCAGLYMIPALRPFRNDFAVLAILLTFIDMNPYRRSDLTKIFYFFYAENQLKNIMPYLKNCTLTGLWKDTGAKLSDEIRYITYSVLAIIWAVGFSLFSLKIVLKSFPGLFYQIQLGHAQSKYSAMVVMSMLLFITGYLFLDLVHTLFKNVLSPILMPLRNVKTKAKEYKKTDISLDEIGQKLKQNMLFNQFSGGAINFILNSCSIRTMKKGSHLIIQGSSNRDVYFLVKGSVDVSVREKTGRRKHVVTLGSDTIIGEMAILEKTKRTANVIAAEDIVYLEIPEKIFSALMTNDEFSDDFNKLKSRIEISQFVSTANLFKDFPPEVMNLFVEAGDLVLFPGGHNIVDEGEKDKTFYLLIKGKVDIYKDNEKIAELGQGDFFGEVALIANVPRTATVKAIEDSLFLYIEDKKFWNILSENIELAMYIESVGRHRMAEVA